MASLKISQIDLRQFRNHDKLNIVFPSRVTVITGKNGSGKTSVVEAVYMLLRGTSFRGSDSDIVKHGYDAYRIEAQFDNHTRILRYQESTGKQFEVDANKSKRLGRDSKYPVVLFEPSDLQLIHGSPSRRRRYIDQLISNYTPSYSTVLRKYDRTLKQRNSLLKNGINSQDDLFTWDVLLSEYGAQIIEQRLNAIETINQSLEAVYHDMTGVTDQIKLNYTYSPKGTNHTKYLHDQLRSNFHRDQAAATTSSGPHRHDVTVSFNSSEAAQTASRGEIRSIILSLKMIELGVLRQKTGQVPLLLLDDVFSELDSDRQKHLMSVTTDSQIIMTTATGQVVDEESVNYIKLTD